MLTFYTNPQSRGRIVHWMLEEVGASYEAETLEYGTTMKAPAYLAVTHPDHWQADGYTLEQLEAMRAAAPVADTKE